MRSQKIRNKAPRPFKKGGGDFGWSGGNKNDAVLPPKKPLTKIAKANDEAKTEPPGTEQ